jgi:predicted DNA-binding transcriptional regulator YafY
MLGYFETSRIIMAWCETRRDFRSFRADRVVAADFLTDRYPERPALLRAKWRKAMEAEREKWAKKNEACGDVMEEPRKKANRTSSP